MYRILNATILSMQSRGPLSWLSSVITQSWMSEFSCFTSNQMLYNKTLCLQMKSISLGKYTLFFLLHNTFKTLKYCVISLKKKNESAEFNKIFKFIQKKIKFIQSCCNNTTFLHLMRGYHLTCLVETHQTIPQ